MGDYKSTELVGTSYKRGKKLIFFNTLNANPALHIEEELVYNLNDEMLNVPAGLIIKEIHDLSTEFEIRDPMTGEPMGETRTYLDIYSLLYSLYWHLATERDNGS